MTTQPPAVPPCVRPAVQPASSQSLRNNGREGVRGLTPSLQEEEEEEAGPPPQLHFCPAAAAAAPVSPLRTSLIVRSLRWNNTDSR